MAMPRKKPAQNVDDFIRNAAATQADQARKKQRPGPKPRADRPATKYLLAIPADLRKAIKKEAIDRDMDMSAYICAILAQRKKLTIE